MKKFWLICFVLIISVLGEASTQQARRITVTELGPLGGAIRTITVNAGYITSGQQSLSLESGFEVIRESVIDPSTGKWSGWELVNRSPACFSNIRTYYEHLHMDIALYPNGTRFQHMDGRQYFRLATIPRGQSSSIWWGEDGRTIYSFFEWYVIIP